MAFPDGEDFDRRARRRRDRRMPSPPDENDWSAESEYRRRPMPYRNRDVKRAMVEGAEPRPSPHRRSREPPFQPDPAAMLVRRPSAVPRRARDPLPYEHTSGTDSRRSSRKGYSPRYYVSTPGSKRSSHTTVSDSDGESSWTPSSQDDDRGRISVKRFRPPPKAEPPRRARHGGRRPKLAVPLVPEVIERDDEDESDDDDDEEEEEEDESDSEDTEEEEEAGTEPRLRARLRGRRIPEEDIPSRSPSRPRYPADRPRERQYRDPPRSEDHYRPPSSRRLPRRTYGSDIVHVKQPAVRRSNTIGGYHAPSTLTTSTRRSPVFDSFLPRSRTTYERHEKIAKCHICYEEFPSRKTAKLGCGHRMCDACLERLFTLSVKDPQHMPPRCCGDDYIPLKHVEHLFDAGFKKTWNRKFHEHSTRDRLYCPSRRCGAWIQPENIYEDRGRKSGRCGRCGTKVCGDCGGKYHSSRECPVDEETNEILEQARDEGWQRCYRCRTMVVSEEGCNHMTCRCGAQFCMICGDKWKTCDCQWFNYDTMEPPDDFDDRVPVPTLARSETFPRSPPSRHYRGSEPPTAPPLAPRILEFEDEIPTRPVRDYRDRGLARRFERLTPRDVPPPEPHPRERDRPRGRERGPIDEPVREVMRDDDYDYDDDDYDGYDFDEDGEYRGSGGDDVSFGPPRRRRRGGGFGRGDETVVPISPPPTAPHAYDRGARTADYISDVSKARGVRGSSMERRLADRFSTQRAAQGPPPPQSPTRGHPHHPPHGIPPMSPMMSLPPAPLPMAPMAPAPLARRHTAEEDMYGMVGPPLGRGRHEFMEEMPGRRHSDETLAAKSAMAGLNGAGRGMNRVVEWMTYVSPGPPDDEMPGQRRRLHY